MRRPRPSRSSRRAPLLTALVTAPALALALAPGGPSATADEPSTTGGAAPPSAHAEGPAKQSVDIGKGGAVSSVDPYATRIGLQVLEAGGNAVDAAVATAAALGVTEPFSAGIGGGGYLVRLDGRTGRVMTLDGRETAPLAVPRDAFVDPATGDPYPFYPDLVTSGLSVGTPGTLATWETALEKWGSRSLRSLLRPSAELARDGFVVDETFRAQVEQNADRFSEVRPTRRLFLRGGTPPEVGSTFLNPQLARTYDLIARRGTRPFYRGALGKDVVAAVRRVPAVKDTELPVPGGYLRPRDLRRYEVLVRKPITTDYRGYTVHGMGSSSSGGSTVGEALEILETVDLTEQTDEVVEHAVLEASALAFADRAEYVGDREFVDVPDEQLLSPTYAAERACALSLERAADKPVPAGDVRRYDGRCEGAGGAQGEVAEDHENVETTHLVTADRWGTVVSYTLTIEQTGGAGIVVPGRGFLLNNELTDFSLEWERRDPNRMEPGKRPRSSMSPTIVTKKGRPVLAVGSPGGSTIITTVLDLLVDVIDLGSPVDEAIAAPRATQRNTPVVPAEPAYLALWQARLEDRGHLFEEVDGGEIGAATAIEWLGPRRVLAAAEPVRRGGGDARVVDRE